MEGGEIGSGPEHRTSSIETTALFSSKKGLDTAIRVGTQSPGIRVEVLPKETADDVEVAANAYALSAEVTGDQSVDPHSWYHRAREAIKLGGGVVQITVDTMPGEQKPDSGRFWRDFERMEDPQEE